MRNIQILKITSYFKGLYFYFPIFTFFLLAKDIPLSAVVLALVFYSASTFLGEVPTGIFADRFGQKASIIVGYIFEATGILFVLFFPTVLGLYVASCIRGLAASFLSGSIEALLFETIQKTKTHNFQKTFSQLISNEQISFVVATAVCALAYQYFGNQAFVPLIIASASCVIIEGALSLFLTDYKSEMIDESKGSGAFSILKEGFSLIGKNATIFALTVVSILTIPGEYFIQSVYQPHFQTNGVPPFWIGASLSIGLILNIIAIRYVYVLEKYFTLEKILLYINLILASGYIFLAFFLHPIFLVALYALMNGIFNIERPIISDYINSRTPSNIRTTVLSGISASKRFFQALLDWTMAISLGALGIQSSLILFGVYLLIGISIGYYLLIRCGCTHKIIDPEGEKFEFN